MRTYLILLVFFSFPFFKSAYGQHQERRVLLYNIAFGGFTSGVGAIINTPKDGNWKQNFVRAFWQGCVGGSLLYTSKKTLYFINKEQQLIYSWPARIQHAAGTSIIQNAALNRPFLQDWAINIGPVRFYYQGSSGKKVKARFLPFSLYAIIGGLRNEGVFDVRSSILLGDIVFESDHDVGGNSKGMSYGRGFTYLGDSSRYHTISHELVHDFQFSEYQILNTWLNPVTKRLKSTKLKQVFSDYIYFDMPYFFGAYYLLGEKPLPKYYRNFFEFEAERFATNLPVPIN